MNRSIILALAFVALVYSQQSTFTVKTLVSGTSQSGTFAVTTPANGLNSDVYSLVIPANIPSWTISVTNTNTAGCTYIAYNIRDEAPACSTGLDGYLLCELGDYDYAGSSADTNTYAVDYKDSLYNYVQNKTIYISIARDSNDYDEICSYTVLATYTATTCTATQVAYIQDGTSVCKDVNMIGFNTPVTALSPVAVDAIYKVNIPSASIGTVYINGVFNDSISIYTRQYATPTTSRYACVDTFESYNSTSELYTFTFVCPTPRIGDYYIAFVTDSDEAVNGTFTVTYDNCNGTMGGYKCNFPVAPLPATSGTVAFNSNSSLEITGYSWVYYYFDLPAFASNAGGAKTLTASDSTGTGTYMYVRRGGFPEDDAAFGYENSGEWRSLSGNSITVNFFDYYVPGRIYFGFACDSATCTVAFSLNSTSSGVVTTGTTTADASTTEQTSSSVVVAFSAVLLFIAALF